MLGLTYVVFILYSLVIGVVGSMFIWMLSGKVNKFSTFILIFGVSVFVSFVVLTAMQVVGVPVVR